MLAYMKFRKFH